MTFFNQPGNNYRDRASNTVVCDRSFNTSATASAIMVQAVGDQPCHFGDLALPTLGTELSNVSLAD